MKKIPTVFRRDPADMKHVTSEVNPECQWVIDGEGVPTRKYDGTCVMLDEDGRWWARREVKPGKAAPAHFEAISTDPNTGKTMGWEPIEQSPFAKFHAEAVAPVNEFGALFGRGPTPGTYELVGPKINGNPERAAHHRLESHANAERIGWDDDRDVTQFESLRDMVLWLAEDGIEGVVWHHPDGRMAKLKGRDFPAPTHRATGETLAEETKA